MEYKVSEQVRQKFDALVKDEKVQKALKFMEEDQDAVIDRQIELTLIPAAEWKWLDGNKDGTFECYYFGNDGYMLSDTTTPDNYQVIAVVKTRVMIFFFILKSS